MEEMPTVVVQPLRSELAEVLQRSADLCPCIRAAVLLAMSR